MVPDIIVRLRGLIFLKALQESYFSSRYSVKHLPTRERILKFHELFGVENVCYTSDYSAFESSISKRIESCLVTYLMKRFNLPKCEASAILYDSLVI